jgi:hypothetical protein
VGQGKKARISVQACNQTGTSLSSLQTLHTPPNLAVSLSVGHSAPQPPLFSSPPPPPFPHRGHRLRLNKPRLLLANTAAATGRLHPPLLRFPSPLLHLLVFLLQGKKGDRTRRARRNPSPKGKSECTGRSYGSYSCSYSDA